MPSKKALQTEFDRISTLEQSLQDESQKTNNGKLIKANLQDMGLHEIAANLRSENDISFVYQKGPFTLQISDFDKYFRVQFRFDFEHKQDPITTGTVEVDFQDAFFKAYNQFQKIRRRAQTELELYKSTSVMIVKALNPSLLLKIEDPQDHIFV